MSLWGQETEIWAVPVRARDGVMGCPVGAREGVSLCGQETELWGVPVRARDGDMGCPWNSLPISTHCVVVTSKLHIQLLNQHYDPVNSSCSLNTKHATPMATSRPNGTPFFWYYPGMSTYFNLWYDQSYPVHHILQLYLIAISDCLTSSP